MYEELNISYEQVSVVVILIVSPDGFPNWLLQLDGGIPNDDNVAVEGPHFYCQGDGLGKIHQWGT